MLKYGLIGEKLGHSFSPLIHARLHDYNYRLYEVEPDKLAEFMKTTDLSGFNVTIPYKQAVIPFCGELSEAARAIGSVNTVIKKEDGIFFGDNTDYYGFEYLVKKSGVAVKGKKAIILGNGGASKTVAAVLKAAGCEPIVVISRKGENNYTNLQLNYDARIIVNCTPVGMYPNNGKSVIDLAPFKKCELALDLIYNPHKTEFLLQAEALGIPAFSGLSMLVAQAKKAADIFTSTVTDEAKIDEIEKNILAQTMNVFLIGMPGSGKTTVGKLLAQALDREFIDMDEEIEKQVGITIPEIFAKGGEKGFRKIETEVLSEVSKQSGKIIAGGGGIVTAAENYKLLKQNSLVVLLERPLSELPSDGRPLSQSKGVAKIYAERKPLYEAWADVKVQNDEPEKAVFKILESL